MTLPAMCNIARIRERMDIINSYTDQTQGEGITRIAYSVQERSSLEKIMEWCIELGLDTQIDRIGNLIATWRTERNSLPVIAIGSHLDSVINGGKYDGVVGVIGALEVIQVLKEKRINPIYPIQIIVFACEESSRFNISMIGSKILTGIHTFEQLKEIKDIYNKSLENVLEECHLQFNKPSFRDNDKYKAFLELHIEQGSILEQNNYDIGIVAHIAAPTRLKIEIEGVAAHSGTTPLNKRKDGLVSAVKIINQINEIILRYGDSRELVATVSKLEVKPNVMNVIPGRVIFYLDIRSSNWDLKEKLCNDIKEIVKETVSKDSLTFSWHVLEREEPITFNQELNEHIEQICKKLMYKHHYMTSFAGHDAMNMTKAAPSALIFIPSKDGISHNPKEYTSNVQIEKGINVLINTVISLIESKELA